MKKETWITTLVILFTWYIIPGFIYLHSPKNAFLFITTVFLFIQCILSDNFLKKYKVSNHFNLVGQKELNYSKIQNYRIWTTNLTISFYTVELTLPDNFLNAYFKPLCTFLSWPSCGVHFLSLMITWLLVYAISNLLEFMEKSIANLMKKQNNF